VKHLKKGKINSRLIIPLAGLLISVVFIWLGLSKFGFWDGVNGPKPGFFPTIIGTVLLLVSLFLLKVAIGSESPKYFKIELMVILGAIGVIAMTYIIGLIPSVILYIVVWLRFYEKTPWISTLKVTGFMSVIIIGAFVFWLKVPFPMGLLENLL
jgi:hypothetical protein